MCKYIIDKNSVVLILSSILINKILVTEFNAKNVNTLISTIY